MEIIFLIGRILFGLLFVASGFAHLTDKGQMAGYAESRGVKPGRPAVLVSGLMIVVGGVLVVLGVWIDLGAIMIGLFLLPTAVLMHGFWGETDAQAKQMEQVMFMKDIALLGGALILLYLAWEFGNDAGLTITDPLFNG